MYHFDSLRLDYVLQIFGSDVLFIHAFTKCVFNTTYIIIIIYKFREVTKVENLNFIKICMSS